ncbi:flagellar hook-basal body complex protein [Achromobacter mucicolens]|jgi:flagellar hook protein FlgE|uniref:Flagellar hook protein FlgE n=1 Tax=Achromobacter mucicolens TaxID=1389922 RepID=A0ABD4Z1C8_9BURK|nr:MULTISPECIES: flagellar hook-basal body complex protein [Achromobacter]KRB17180.1 flagellar biosynthesis protein FlgE [Achromobacter sp. Root170]MDH1181376.1 flagellar hook-basal body complex protein [Achromobacter mucicolens]
MGFGQGLSGLNAAAQNLDVIGNNIANSGTVGFKSATASFADVYASSRVGLGVKVAAINQRFTVGAVTGGGGEYDIAIDGAKGMFRVTDQSGSVMYTRNGEFLVDKNNFIVNAQGYRLTGYPAGAIGANPVELQLPTANVAPQATSTATTVANLDANAKVIYQVDTVTSPAVPGSVTLGGTAYTFTKAAGGALTWTPANPPANTYGTAPNTVTIDGTGQVTAGALEDIPGFVDYTAAVTEIGKPFDPKISSTYTNASPMTVFDSLGNSHQVMQYFVKREATAGTSVYDVYYTMDGQAMAPTTEAGGVWGNPQQFTFNNAGTLTSAPIVNLTFAQPGGTATPADPLNIAVNYTGTTQYGSNYKLVAKPDGYTSGEFSGINISSDGSLVASYTNGETQVVGTLVLADFSNLQGLQPVGNNAWKETAASGQPILGQPGTNSMSTVVGQATEASNVDMSRELVNMIIAQRTYQANSQTIKTQDEIMQVLMNLK